MMYKKPSGQTGILVSLCLLIIVLVVTISGCIGKGGLINFDDLPSIDSKSPSIKVTFLASLFPNPTDVNDNGLITYCFNESEECANSANHEAGESAATLEPCDRGISIVINANDASGIKEVVIFFPINFPSEMDAITRAIIENGVTEIMNENSPEWNEEWDFQAFENIELELGTDPQDPSIEGYMVRLKEIDPNRRFENFSYFMHFDCLCYSLNGFEFYIYAYDFAGNEFVTGKIPIVWNGNNLDQQCDGLLGPDNQLVGYEAFERETACIECQNLLGELTNTFEECPCY